MVNERESYTQNLVWNLFLIDVIVGKCASSIKLPMGILLHIYHLIFLINIQTHALQGVLMYIKRLRQGLLYSRIPFFPSVFPSGIFWATK